MMMMSYSQLYSSDIYMYNNMKDDHTLTFMVTWGLAMSPIIVVTHNPNVLYTTATTSDII